jgi:peptide/nickel transport system substrate-binding protein
MLQNVGVRLDMKTVPANEFFDKYILGGNFDVTIFSWQGTVFPISSSYSLFRAPQGGNVFQNFSRVGSAEIDAAMTKAVSDLDPDQAVADADAADRLIWQEVGVIPLYQRPDIFAAKRELANFGASGFADTIWEDIGFTNS